MLHFTTELLHDCITCSIISPNQLFQGDVLQYEILEDEAGQKAMEFFWINPDTGILVATSALTESTSSQFRVSLVYSTSQFRAYLVYSIHACNSTHHFYEIIEEVIS